jgi:hypothetical protein
MTQVFGGPPAEPRTALAAVMDAQKHHKGKVLPRTVEDIEAELVRVAQWTIECSCCGGRRMVATPWVDLKRLTDDPDGPYADGVMAMLYSAYPPSERS